MESATIVHGVSFEKEPPRLGQLEVFRTLNKESNSLNIKLPTGYGKTYTMCGVYSILHRLGRVNRLLVIFPTTAQLDQFERNGIQDLKNASVPIPHQMVDIRYFGHKALLKHRKNEAQIFLITVQSLKESRGMTNCVDLTSNGQWMICVDEYHHYGIDKTWSNSVLNLNRQFLLAMSATPQRADDDSAFGKPDISILYRSAQEEKAVKKLVGHAYNYRLDAINETGDVKTYTTSELTFEAGGDSPEKIEKFRIRKKMRWSPKYISPLVTTPIERMIQQRTATGHKLQALVVAMCVSHAEMVCGQLKNAYPDLAIDWIGTGDNGRSDEENKSILDKFVPAKDEWGDRPRATLDVLVNVGICGEGIDTTHVSEVVHLTNASICNRTNQINGRPARFLKGPIPVIGHINFDASSEYAIKGYVGSSIMDAMDLAPPKGEEHPEDCDCPLCNRGGDDIDPFPDEPQINILNLELIHIDSGDEGVRRMAEVLHQKHFVTYDLSALLKDPTHPEWERSVIPAYRIMRSIEAEKNNEKSVLAQWEESVNSFMRAVAGRVVRLSIKPGTTFERSLVGDICKRINQRKKYEIGAVERDLNTLKKHYRWLKALEVELLNKRIPTWLE